MASDKIQTFTDTTLPETLKTTAQPVLVDFWAEWCMPCRRIAPIVEQLAAEFEGRAVVGKLNVDESPSTAAQYGVQSIPTLLVFKGGKLVDSAVGLRGKDELKRMLEQHV